MSLLRYTHICGGCSSQFTFRITYYIKSHKPYESLPCSYRCSKVTSEGLAQQACLGVLRSDYMLHEPLAPSNSPADANAVAAASIAATVIDSRDPAIAAAEVAVAAAQATADNRNWDGGNSAGGDEAAEQPPAPRLLQVQL